MVDLLGETNCCNIEKSHVVNIDDDSIIAIKDFWRIGIVGDSIDTCGN